MSINATDIFEGLVFSVYFNINKVRLHEYSFFIFLTSLVLPFTETLKRQLPKELGLLVAISTQIII